MSTRVSRDFIIKMIVFAALVLIAIYVMNNTYWAEETISKPLSGEAATNPFYTVQHLADALGARGEWKHVLGNMPSTDSVILLAYWNWDVIAARREKLHQWVEQGGRLILDASLIANESSLKHWAGLEYQMVAPKHKDDDDDADEDDDQQETKADDHGDVCNSLHLIDHRPDANPDRDSLRVCNYNWGRFITSTQPVVWGVRDTHGLQAARVNIGKGSVTLFNGTPFANLELLKGEHGLLFVGATQLHHGDHIYFFMDEKGTPLLKLIWLYGSPVVILSLCLVVAALWRNGMRFGPLAATYDTARRSLAEQISGTGKFILRFNGSQVLHAATVRALDEAARRHITHYDHLGSQDRIVALAAASGMDAEALGNAVNFQGQRRVTELRHAIALMEQARRHLLNNKRSGNQFRRSNAS